MRIKKSNIEIVKNYINGQRPFVSVGYTPPNIVRKEGEIWVDASGQKWIQKKGFRTKINEQADLIRKASKRKCNCGQDIEFGNRLDQKFFAKTGKCFDCVIKEETELRILGVYPHYERYKMISNYLGFIKDLRSKIIDSIKYLESEPGTLDVLCNGEGFIEKFRGLNTKELLDEAKKDLKTANETILKVTKDKEKARRIYHKELIRAKKTDNS